MTRVGSSRREDALCSRAVGSCRGQMPPRTSRHWLASQAEATREELAQLKLEDAANQKRVADYENLRKQMVKEWEEVRQSDCVCPSDANMS
eukprot:343207-Pyramimonas_sp.AAC.2